MFSIAMTSTTTRCGLVALTAVAMGLCAGCAGRSLQAENPVLAAAPPRQRLAVAAQTADVGTARTGDATSDVQQASFADSADAALRLSGDISGIAATVNGRPILISDVIERFTPQLAAAEKQLPEAKFAELKRELIKRELPAHIEQAILVDTALSKLKPEQKEQVDEQLDKFFGQYVSHLQGQMGVNSLVELETLLQREGTSVTDLQRSFNNRQLAEQAMGLLAPPEPTITRSDLLKEYQSRLDEFTEPERVRWQQIRISYKKHGDQDKALGVLEQVVQSLKSGMPFEQVARKHSDGIKAADGGQWDWTHRGELSDAETERLLFELPIGEFGPVVKGENAFQIVRVTERLPETTKPFAELQNQLGEEIKKRKQQAMLDKILADVKDQAIVTTMFDGEPDDEG